MGVGTSDGVERSGTGLADGQGALRYEKTKGHVAVGAKKFTYPAHVITPEMDNEALFAQFMPQRIEAFLEGVNVNVMAYGQTGTGKTHTMFGTPGIMERAGKGEFGAGGATDVYRSTLMYQSVLM